MPKIAELAFLTGQIRAQDFSPLGGLGHFMSPDWVEHDGYRYCSIKDSPLIQEKFGLVRTTAGYHSDIERLLEGVEVELIDVTGEIPPHYHAKSDAVLRCVSFAHGQSEHFVEVGGARFWDRTDIDDLFVLPRQTAHGFRRFGAGDNRFMLVGFNYPPIGDDDTKFV